MADQGGAGTEIDNLVISFSLTDGNFSPVNIGQLKAVALPFYNRLREVGFNTNQNLKANGYSYLWSSDYPWDDDEPHGSNYSIANLGQLKLVFSFDLSDSDGDGIRDYLEGFYPAYSETRDTDGDGIPDISDPDPNVAITACWVKPTAPPGGNGLTNNTPFNTIEQAKLFMRGVSKGSGTGNFYVKLMPGEYFLTTPVVFTNQDSGSGPRNVVYQSVDDLGNYAPGRAKIHSGARLYGWTQVVNSYGRTIWRANPSDTATSPNFAGVDLNWLPTVTRTIIDTTATPSQTFAWLARIPNQTAPNPRANPLPSDPDKKYAQISRAGYDAADGGGVSNNSPATTPPNNVKMFYKADFNPIAANSEISASPLGSVCWWAPGNTTTNVSEWDLNEYPIRDINTTNKRFLLWTNSNLDARYGDDDGGFRNIPGVDDRFFVQGFSSLLDSAGEFFFPAGGTSIDYLPFSGGMPTVRVPINAVLFQINGGKNLIFQGIEFAYTQLYSPTTKQGAIQILPGSSYITINQCHIHHVGSAAVEIQEGAFNNSVVSTWIHDCGVSGIIIKGTPTYTQYASNNLVNACLIQNVGCLVTESGTGGVILSNTNSCSIFNTKIDGSSRYGISLRGDIIFKNGVLFEDTSVAKSRNNVLNNVLIDHCSSDSGDSAGLHMVGINKNNSGGPINRFLNINIRHTFDFTDDTGPWGIYVDRNGGGTRHQIFKNVNAPDDDGNGSGYHHNNNPDQEFHNVSWDPPFSGSQMTPPLNQIGTAGASASTPFVGLGGPLQ